MGEILIRIGAYTVFGFAIIVAVFVQVMIIAIPLVFFDSMVDSIRKKEKISSILKDFSIVLFFLAVLLIEVGVILRHFQI